MFSQQNIDNTYMKMTKTYEIYKLHLYRFRLGPIPALSDHLFRSYGHLNKGRYIKNGLKLDSFI